MHSEMFRRAGSRKARAAALVVGASLTLALAATAASAGPAAQAECETFVDYYNIYGLRIQNVLCSGASGYHAVLGIDVIGEWIEVIIESPVTGYYRPIVAYQVEYEEMAGVKMTVIDEDVVGVNRVSYFKLEEGWGLAEARSTWLSETAMSGSNQVRTGSA